MAKQTAEQTTRLPSFPLTVAKLTEISQLGMLFNSEVELNPGRPSAYTGATWMSHGSFPVKRSPNRNHNGKVIHQTP